MKRYFLSAAVALAALPAMAVAPMWTRDVRISPDGKQIAFSYKGDIYTVSTNGGAARRITSGDSYESNPVWSPSGDRIAFASDRNGGRDVYIIPAEGGAPLRLTFNSARQFPEAFSPDGKYVIFSASIQDPASSVAPPMAPLTELYSVPAEGGRITQILAAPAQNISMLPDGSFLYEDVKGLEDKWRKHHTSSVTRDIWIYNPSDNSYRNLTSHAGEDRSPAVIPGSNHWYFLSERDGGSFNVYEADGLAPVASPRKITDFKDHPVRFLSAANDGTLAFTYNGEIYTISKDGRLAKTPIDVTDLSSDELTSVPVAMNEAAVSPDGKQVAFVARGEIFVTSSEYPSTKQITHTPAMEGELSWGADNRTLYYASLRNGRSNIYKARIARADDPNFSNATLIEEEALFPEDGFDRGCPKISPDGKKMAFVYDRNRLMLMDLASKEVKEIMEKPITGYRDGNTYMNWSPDSRRIAIMVASPMHEPYSDISIVDAVTGEYVPVTRSGYFDEMPRWSPDGNAVLFSSERYGMRNHASWGSEYDVLMAFLNKESYDKFRLSEEDLALLKDVEEQQKKDAAKEDSKDKKDKKKGKKDKKDEKKSDDASAKAPLLEPGIEDRIVRLTPNSSQISDFALSSDGETLYYLSAVEGNYDLWKANLRKGDVSIAKKLGVPASYIQTDKDGNLYIVGKSVSRFNPKSSEMKNISISGKVKIDPAKEREAMLNYVEREARERFYLPEMPVDWEAYVENYRRFLPHINNNHDFADLLSELLGELNVSHSGGRYFAAPANEATASLGLMFDLSSADADGLKIEDIVAGGPFDRATTKVQPGDFVMAINGEKVTPAADWSALLNGQAGKKTLVSFRNPSSGNTWDEVVLPISQGKLTDLYYHRWIKHNEQVVDSLSGGRLGYIHIRNMNDESFRPIYSKLFGEFIGKEGIVIDTRWNGGGRMHEDIEVLFSGEKYLTQEIHGRQSSDMPSRRWNKPSIMLVCEANYSNAHGTPWVYQHKKLGKVVGMPVPGTMSSVNWIPLQDPGLLFGVPVIAFRTAEGNVLENTQLEPDIKVENRPDDLIKGVDSQLEMAVKALLNDIDAAK